MVNELTIVKKQNESSNIKEDKNRKTKVKLNFILQIIFVQNKN